jgi:hypothetical protein
MPKYFFHVMDGRATVDLEGVDLADVSAARDEAIKTAGTILAEEGMTFWKGREWNMTVADEKGSTVFSLKFQADNHEN